MSNKTQYLTRVDKVIQVINNENIRDYSNTITDIVKHIMYITNKNITTYIERVIKKNKLSYMQYTLLIDIVRIVENDEKRDITSLLQYIEDDLGAKQYGVNELLCYNNGKTINSQIASLFSHLELNEVVAVLRILATFM